MPHQRREAGVASCSQGKTTVLPPRTSTSQDTRDVCLIRLVLGSNPQSYLRASQSTVNPEQVKVLPVPVRSGPSPSHSEKQPYQWTLAAVTTRPAPVASSSKEPVRILGAVEQQQQQQLLLLDLSMWELPMERRFGFGTLAVAATSGVPHWILAPPSAISYGNEYHELRQSCRGTWGCPRVC